VGKKKNKKKSSSWGGVIKSYLKEFLLDYDMGRAGMTESQKMLKT